MFQPDNIVNIHGKYMRAKQAAAYLGIPISTFYQLVAQGVLPQAVKLTGRISLYKRDALDAIIAQKSQ